MFLYILLGFLALTILLVFYMGFHKPIVVERKRLGRRYVLYRETATNYRELGTLYKGLRSDLKDVFKDYVFFGVYYDDPRALVDPSQFRVSYGIYVNENEINKAQGFATIHKQYRFKELPEMDAISTTFPHKNHLSFFWASVRIYPKLFGYLAQHNVVEDRENELDGHIENYNWSGSDRFTEYLIPYGKWIKQHTLTSLPQPALKPGHHRKSD